MKKYQIQKRIYTHFIENKALYTFTIVLFLIGVIFGAIIVNSLSVTQKYDLYMYLSQFFGQVSKGDIAASTAIFTQSFIHYVKYIGLMWILGLSIIGLPIIFVLLFLKGVVIGFTVGFLVNQMGFSGFLLSSVSVMPQNFILVPAFIVVGTASISFSFKMIRQQFLRNRSLPIFPQFLSYSLLIVCIGGALAVASMFEAYVSPTLMKFVLSSIM